MSDEADEGSEPVGGFDLGGLLAQAQDLLAIQTQAAAQVVEGQAGGGVVRVRVTGGMDFQAVTIAPEAVAEGDADLLADLVLAALHDAMAQVASLSQASLGSLEGFDLGALLGGADDIYADDGLDTGSDDTDGGDTGGDDTDEARPG